MAFAHILTEKRERVGIITINRQERMNAINAQTIQEIWQAISIFEGDREVSVVAFTGAGNRAFCAGLELTGLMELGPIPAYHFTRRGQALITRLENLLKPTVALVNGLALGAGLEFCLACDLALAAENASFGFPEVRLGIIPSWGGMRRLSLLIGKRRAKEMVFTGKIIGAVEAKGMGLVNAVVPPGEMMDRLMELASSINSGGRVALWQAKKVMDHELEMNPDRALDWEAECFATCFSTAEPRTMLEEYIRGGEEERGAEPASPTKEKEIIAGTASTSSPADKETAPPGEEELEKPPSVERAEDEEHFFD